MEGMRSSGGMRGEDFYAPNRLQSSQIWAGSYEVLFWGALLHPSILGRELEYSFGND